MVLEAFYSISVFYDAQLRYVLLSDPELTVLMSGYYQCDLDVLLIITERVGRQLMITVVIG